MSSYNENLHANVVASLQSQELEQKKVKAQKNASMFTLYYAEGATITAREKLKEAGNVLDDKTIVKEQAVINSNISNNLLSSANQANQYLKQSSSNTAVCAANVQVAANAIVKLSSDLGGIRGIVYAADASTDIFDQTATALSLIEKTAYNAEVASQMAMEASMLTSEVSASTVMDKAKSTNDYMNNVLKVTSDDFNASSQAVANDNATLASVSATEKLSEGDYEDISVDFNSTNAAYNATNTGLNLGLTVTDKTANSFIVQFNDIQSPFEKDPDNTDPSNPLPYYPVDNYYIILVKDSKKSIFSISNAEGLLTNKTSTARQYVPYVPNHTVTPVNPAIQQSVTFPLVLFPDGNQYNLQDSDGDMITCGTQYVVFVLAVYSQDYKKKLNSFDDFLSAASSSFKLTNTLAAVDGKSIVLSPADGMPNSLTFQVSENPQYQKQVEYRCIFLPRTGMDKNSTPNTLLSMESYMALNAEVVELDAIADKYDPEIAVMQAKIYNADTNISSLVDKSTELSATIKSIPENPVIADAEKSGTIQKTQVLLDAVEAEKTNQTTLRASYQTQLDQLEKDRDQAMQTLSSTTTEVLGFLFNKEIAEQVLAGNYSIAKLKTAPDGTGTAATDANTGTANDNAKPVSITWQVDILPGTTDNFGNLIMPDQTYIPVILSYSTAKEENLDMFTNSWSGYLNSPVFPTQKTNS